MRGFRTSFELEGTAKCSGSVIQFSKLSFDQSQLKIHFGSGLECECSTQFILSRRKIVLLGINATQETMGCGVPWIKLYRALKLLEGGGLIVKVILRRSQTEMCVAPCGFQAQRFLELVHGVLGVTAVFQRESEVVVCGSVVRFEGNRVVICHDCLIPRFVLGEF